MVNWSEAGGIAAVVSALYLPFVLSPTAYGALKATEDVLHDCGTLAAPYINSVDCYCGARTLDDVFNKAIVGNSVKLVPKPKQLALDRRYLLTDVKTLSAFVLCSTEKAPSFTNIQIRENENLSVAEIHGSTKCRLDVTKSCLEGRIAGYPPWYREQLIVAHGPVIPHPIRTRDDIHRAGSVVAVGLSKITPLPSSWADVGLMHKPVRRVLNKLRDEIQPHFLQDPTIGAAASAIQYMLQAITCSNVERYITVDLHQSFQNGVIAALSGSDCLFAMSLFNDVGPLSEHDRFKLASIIKPVIDAASRGCYIVIQHFKNATDFSLVPDSLGDLSRQVYLDLGNAN
ncbi:MAG: hypothetical protein Q9221_006995 [Calogaya cf. arnoldii]